MKKKLPTIEEIARDMYQEVRNGLGWGDWRCVPSERVGWQQAIPKNKRTFRLAARYVLRLLKEAKR